jgi:hypothetical protein
MSSRKEKAGPIAATPSPSPAKRPALVAFLKSVIPTGGRLAGRFAAIGARLEPRRRSGSGQTSARRHVLYPDTH